MAKSKTDRAASAGGSFLGGLANNPAIVIIALVLGGLFIFRDKISEGISGLGEGLFNFEFPAFPEIKFPDFNFPEFPEIKFPDFPDFTSQFEDIFSGFQEQLDNLFSNQQSIIAGQTVTTEQGQDVMIPPDTVIDPDTGIVTSSTPPTVVNGGATFEENLFAQNRAGVFDTLVEILGLSPTQAGNIVRGATTQADLERILFEANQGKFTPTNQPTGLDNMGVGFDVPFNDPLGLGGGGSFIGGTTTFGDETNIIDTLSEVLAIFPNLTASQAADALAENAGLTGNQFAQIDPDIINISSAGIDPEQILNNTSDPSLSGLTPEQIFQKLFGNIQNF